MSTLAALALLLAGLAWNNAWKWAPVQHQGDVFTAGTGAFVAVLLACVGWGASLPLRAVCVLLTGFALQVLGCNVAFIVKPWHVAEGEELCSSGLRFPLGLTGLWVASLVAQWIYLKGANRG